MKPERIFNFDSGWSIDLDRVVCVGNSYVTITETTMSAFVQIGVSGRSKGSNDSGYIVFEKTPDYEDQDIVDELDKLLDSGDIIFVPSILSFQWSKSYIIYSIWLEYEIKILRDKLHKAWKEWINYKESLQNAK